MSACPQTPPSQEACAECGRRGWLLARLSPVLDRLAPDRERLFALLELEDEQLIDALAGSDRSATHAAYAALDASPTPTEGACRTTCRHRREYPRSLRATCSPRLLHLNGPASRLAQLTDGPVVALLGCDQPSDYGREMAASIARELSCCGVTVVSCAAGGIGEAAQVAAVQAGSRCIALLGDGLALARGSQRPLLARVARGGCAVSELPADASGRRWGPAACALLAAELAQLVVVVEGEDCARELAPARRAQAAGRVLGAVPGRANSRLVGAPHTLLREGASLIEGGEDALELLHAAGDSARARPAKAAIRLEAPLGEVLDDVGAGRDSAQALARARGRPLEETMLALTRLELMGFLSRGRGGRYIRSGSTARRHATDA